LLIKSVLYGNLAITNNKILITAHVHVMTSDNCYKEAMTLLSGVQRWSVLMLVFFSVL